MKRGFTLVEILVVIGIIALLVGILLPVISRAQAASKRTACRAQLADIGRVFNMYLNDSGQRLPRCNPMPSRQPPLNSFPSIVETFRPYTKSALKVWRCPADRIFRDTTGMTGIPDRFETYFEREGSSYEYNAYVNAMLGGDKLSDLIADAKVRMPSLPLDQIHLLKDYDAFHGKPVTTGCTNYLFVDWHVGDLELPAGVTP